MSESSQRAYARLAGFMYFFTAFDVAGVVILSRISGSGSFLDTAHSIAAWETLYRIGVLFGLLGTLSTIVLAIGLYVTLKPVDGNLAMTALLFRLAEATIGGVVVVLAFATLQINLDANHSSAFDPNQLAALADLVGHTSAVATNVSVVFFSVGSTIFFYLFLRSGYIPRWLARWGVVASLFCLAAFVGNLVLPQPSELLIGIGGLPIGIAEPVLGLWLVFRGIDTHSQPPQPVGRNTARSAQ
jgi:hypothetical protein